MRRFGPTLNTETEKNEIVSWIGLFSKVLWLSAFFSNFLKISFGGQFLNFWWFEQSRFIVVFIFLSLSACCQSVSCHCQQKNFCLYFSDATLLAALLQKRCEICLLFLLGLSAIHQKFKNSHQRIRIDNSRKNKTIIEL